jgi:alkyl sulfatase BDS1-like metallo-beta-lactamase superfamily hydrolase
MPIDNIFKIMGVQLNAEKSLDKLIVVGLNDNSSSDSGCTIEIRRCILEVKQQKPDNPKFTIVAESYDDWKKVILGKVTPQDAVDNNIIKINGGTNEDFYNFMDYFLISYAKDSKNRVGSVC